MTVSKLLFQFHFVVRAVLVDEISGGFGGGRVGSTPPAPRTPGVGLTPSLNVLLICDDAGTVLTPSPVYLFEHMIETWNSEYSKRMPPVAL